MSCQSALTRLFVGRVGLASTPAAAAAALRTRTATAPKCVALAQCQFSTTPLNNDDDNDNHKSGRRGAGGIDIGPLLAAFRDPLSVEERMDTPVGRSWRIPELRRKSFDDLHKLWIVLYKERNMLGTERRLARVQQSQLPQPERLRKVKKSMAAIKVVLGERKRDKIAAAALKQLERSEKEGGFANEEDDEEGSDSDNDNDVEPKKGVQETQKVWIDELKVKITSWCLLSNHVLFVPSFVEPGERMSGHQVEAE